MELIKNTIRVGNSAGVLLPKEYLNSQVKIILEPLNIEKDVIELLLEEGILQETKGIYLTGSYAREENTINSDVDILVITSKTNKRIVKEKYELLLISEEKLEQQLQKNIFPLFFMIKESKPIFNSELIEKYKQTPITKKNTKWHTETTKSAMGIIKSSIALSEEMGTKESSASAYSLILRLRGLYLLDSLKKGKIGTTKELKKLIIRLTGSLKIYEGYLNIKANNKETYNLDIGDAKKVLKYILEKIKNQEDSIK